MDFGFGAITWDTGHAAMNCAPLLECLEFERESPDMSHSSNVVWPRRVLE